MSGTVGTHPLRHGSRTAIEACHRGSLTVTIDMCRDQMFEILIFSDLVCHTITDLRSKDEVVKALRTSLASKQVSVCVCVFVCLCGFACGQTLVGSNRVMCG